MEVLQNKLIIW